jgi:transcriptional regulator with XRE-family HTH domain
MKIEEFCAFLKRVRASSKVSIADISKKYGWHRNTITNYEKDRFCDIDYLYALSRECNVSLDSLLTERMKAGFLHYLPEFQDPDFVFSSLLGGLKTQESNIALVKIETDDMAPLIMKGAIAEVDTNSTEVQHNQVIAFRNDKGKVSACRVIEKDNFKYLLSMIPSPSLIDFVPGDLQIIGEIVATKVLFNSKNGN